MLRCACCAFVGDMTNDQELKALAEVGDLRDPRSDSQDWTREAVEMYDLYDTPGEFNSATYAGVTIMALCLGQYCPTESLLHKEAPRLLRSVWQSLGVYLLEKDDTFGSHHRRGVQPIPVESSWGLGSDVWVLYDASTCLPRCVTNRAVLRDAWLQHRCSHWCKGGLCVSGEISP